MIAVDAFSTSSAGTLCIACNDINILCEDNFCSIPCRNKFYDEWTVNSITYAKTTTTTTTNNRIVPNSFSSASMAVRGKYVVQVIKEKDITSRMQINILAWKGFNLSWEDYVEDIVIPCCRSTEERNAVNEIKSWEVPPTTLTKLSRFRSKYKARMRIFFLLYGIVDNCCILRKQIPYAIQLKRMDKAFCFRYDGKRNRKIDVSFSSSTPKMPSSSSGNRSAKRSNRKRSLLEYHDKKEAKKGRLFSRIEERAREAEEEIEYKVLRDRQLRLYRKKVNFILSMSKHWPKVHEQLNAVGGGMPGSLQIEGSFDLLHEITKVLVANDIQQVECLVVEEGMRSADQMRSNIILLPYAHHFGYEYENFRQFSFHDESQTDKAFMELHDLISTFDGTKVSHSKYGMAFNVEYCEGKSSNLTFPQFLKHPCIDPKCTRYLSLREIKRMEMAAHRCASCGFNKHDVFKYFKSKYLISTWFSKSWGKEKRAKIIEMGKVSSKIICFFQGDERSYTNESSRLDEFGLETSTLVMLNSTLKNARDEQRWVCCKKDIICKLVGGGTTFVGAIYLRKKYMKPRPVVVSKTLEYFRNKHNNKLGFNNDPPFDNSPLLQMLTCYRTATVKRAVEALEWEMSAEGSWENFCSLPDIGSITNWVRNKIKNKTTSEVDFVVDVMKKHFGSFRRSYQYVEDGVRGGGQMDMKEIEDDLDVLYSAAEDRDKVYDHDRYICRSCHLEGSKPQVFAHVYGKNDCSKEDVFYVCESTVAEIVENFEERINTMQQEIDGAKGEVAQLQQKVEELTVSEAQKTQAIVLRVIDIWENKYVKKTPVEMQREYLYRLKSNITYRQFREYARWNKEIKKQRCSERRFHFEVNGEKYSVPFKHMDTKHDATTRLELIKAMYDLDFPKPEKLRQGGVDGIVVDSATKAMEARLRLSLRLKRTIRAKRFHHFNGRLLYAINWDGAPFQKNGNLKSQSVLLATCLNEGFTTTIASIIFLAVISAAEDSEHSKALCQNIDKKLDEFKKKVESEGIEIGGLKFTSVDYLLCCDLKATNKLQGVGAHGSEFWSTTHVGLTKDTVGYGVVGRSKSVAALFKNYHREKNDNTKRWKKGDLPIPVTPALRAELRNEVKKKMAQGKHGNGENLNANARKKWEAKAKLKAKNAGHTFYLEEFFPKTVFVTNTYCALHYKTVKVLDFLDLSCLALMNWDRFNGRLDTIGSSLDYFLSALENDKKFKGQLNTYATDARALWIQLDLQQQLCFEGKGLKKLSALLQKRAGVKSPRLLGRQANIPLALLDEFAELLKKSRNCGRRVERSCVGDKSKEHVEKDMDQVISSLLAFLAAVRNVTFWMGQSGTDIYKQNRDASEEDYLAHVHEINKRLKDACLTLELIQTNLFEDYVRPYDVCATYAMPHISDILADLGITQGRAGLLECYESFHKYYANLTAFESATGVGTGRGVSRNEYKFTSMWLIYVFLPFQKYGRQKEERKSKGWKYRSHVIRNDVHKYFHETLTNPTISSCFCGKCSNTATTNPRSDTCSFCNAGNTTCTVGKIFELVSRTKLYIGKRPDRNRGTKRKMEGMYDEWVNMRNKQWVKGLKVVAVF
jgi:hypothetical protein